MSLSRRSFLGSAAAAAIAPGATRKPNIVVIMADDMGFSDIAPYGGEIETPNLTKLAKNGVRFTRFSNGARCCPTRAALLTGLYAHQAGVGGMVEDRGTPGYRGFLNDNCVTMAEALKPAGYRTLMAGKWHVGEKRPHWPCDRGFDRYFGLISGASNYYTVDPERQMALNNDPWKPTGGGFYMTDAFTDHALEFMEEKRGDNPFFLYLAYTSPHWPLHALEKDIAKYKDRYHGGWDKLREERWQRQLSMGIVEKRWGLSKRDPQIPAWADAKDKVWEARRMAVYAAQVDRMDQNIGRLMSKLDENTLVLFLADNGGCAEVLEPGFRGKTGTYITHDGRDVRLGNDPKVMPGPEDTFQSYGVGWANASNTPFRLYKSWVHEGGTASPLIAHWPAALKNAGRLSNETSHVIDIAATALDAAGAKYPANKTPLEGKSLLPILKGGKREGHKALYWEHMGNRAVRSGQYKLVAQKGKPWELYDIDADRCEESNLAATNTAKVTELTALYDGWAKRAHVVE